MAATHKGIAGAWLTSIEGDRRIVTTGFTQVNQDPIVTAKCVDLQAVSLSTTEGVRCGYDNGFIRVPNRNRTVVVDFDEVLVVFRFGTLNDRNVVFLPHSLVEV